MSKTKQLIEEASQFIRICYKELNKEQFMEERMKEIQVEIEKTGTYEHTFEELVHGSRMAWRNSNRCIGRLFWSKMHILDAREVNDEEGVYNALIHHIKYATNDGKVKPTITIFKQYQGEENNIRIYNHQLIRYAGYKTEMGVIGDSHSAAFTDFCQELGWQGEGTHYDVLPLVFSVDGKEPVYREIPKKEVKEVPIEHPEYPISSLGVKWYGVPMISDMRLEIGGISYTAAPFNGWYMGTEIGARNLADHDRYNLLPAVAEMMNLDCF